MINLTDTNNQPNQSPTIQLITNYQPNNSQMIINGSQMINPTDHKEPIKLITTDQHDESQMINPTDHRESTQPITTNQPNGSQTINPTNHKRLNQPIM